MKELSQKTENRPFRRNFFATIASVTIFCSINVRIRAAETVPGGVAPAKSGVDSKPKGGTMALTSTPYDYGPNKASVVDWDECATSQKVSSAFLDYNEIDGSSKKTCKTVRLSPGMAKHLDRYLLSCAQESAEKAGLPKPENLQLLDFEGYFYKEKTLLPGATPGAVKLSLHATGNAFDVIQFGWNAKDGRQIVVSTIKEKNTSESDQKFYSEFRRCWKRSLGGDCYYEGGSIGYEDSCQDFSFIGDQGQTRTFYNNRLHNGHLHLEFPPCAPRYD
jgi:hypothetical protein